MYYVYTFYNASGEPIYVGCTENMRFRMAQHKSKGELYSEIDYIEIKKFRLSYIAALKEMKMIKSLRPKYNKTMNSMYPYHSGEWYLFKYRHKIKMGIYPIEQPTF